MDDTATDLLAERPPYLLAGAVFGCLAQALPGKVQAESAGSIWILGLNSAHGRVPRPETAKAKNLRRHQYRARRHRRKAGQGRAGHHGLSIGRRHHPGRGHRNAVPALFQAQEYLAELPAVLANGAAVFRSRSRSPTARMRPSPSRRRPSTASTTRRRAAMAASPAGGRRGARLRQDAPRQGHPHHAAGDSLVVELPGGGGFGDPKERDPAALMADIAAGCVSVGAARREYGHVSRAEARDVGCRSARASRRCAKARGQPLAELRHWPGFRSGRCHVSRTTRRLSARIISTCCRRRSMSISRGSSVKPEADRQRYSQRMPKRRRGAARHRAV